MENTKRASKSLEVTNKELLEKLNTTIEKLTANKNNLELQVGLSNANYQQLKNLPEVFYYLVKQLVKYFKNKSNKLQLAYSNILDPDLQQQILVLFKKYRIKINT